MCFDCVASFLQNPLNMTFIIISFTIAIVSLLFFIEMRQNFSNRKKLGLLYSTLFFFMFPFVFYLYARTCGNALYSCNTIASIIYTTFVTLGFSVLASFLFIPFIYGFSSKHKALQKTHTLYQKIERHAATLQIKMPHMYIINKAEPSAFSFSHIRPSIFFTVGLTEILKEKEVEAVLLHELGHIQQRSSFLKFTNTLIRLISPISNFNLLHTELNHEEAAADSVARNIQGTDVYVRTAKQKLTSYYEKKEALNRG